jgi:N-acetylmuramate 1-kinase
VDAEQSFKLYIETLYKDSISKGAISPVTLLDIEKLTGDASTRKYYRVITDQGNWVVCLDDPSNKQEHNFREVQGILQQYGVRVPRIYDYRPEKGYLLEEDLGNMTFLARVARCEKISEVETFYKHAIMNLIKMHSIDLTRHPKACFGKQEFDQQKLDQEIELAIDFFIKKYLRYALKQDEYQKLKGGFSTMNKILGSLPKVFCHRDFHSRNMMVKDDEIIVIDFQDARLGVMQYDLVSLLEDSYYQVPEAVKYKMLNLYWDLFAVKSGHYKSRAEFDRIYYLMACQRILKAIGSFSFIFFQRNDTRYLKYVGLSFEKLRFYMEKVPELEEQRNFLTRVYYDA